MCRASVEQFVPLRGRYRHAVLAAIDGRFDSGCRLIAIPIRAQGAVILGRLRSISPFTEMALELASPAAGVRSLNVIRPKSIPMLFAGLDRCPARRRLGIEADTT